MGDYCNISVYESAKQNLSKYDSSEECFQIALEEYRHIGERANKFDNKVYIMITFCSIFFALILGLMEDLMKIEGGSNTEKEVLRLFCILIGVGYVVSLILLIFCLNPIKMKRFNPSILLEKSLWNKQASISYMVAVKHYCEFIIYNNNLLEKRYNKINLVCIIMIVEVILAFLLKSCLF